LPFFAPLSLLFGFLSLQSTTPPPSTQRAISLAHLAPALVMSGTGDLPTLRKLRIRRRSPHLGYHDANLLSLAVGMIFLAGGDACLGRSNAGIAGLVAAS
jgi:hypothetical protein